MPTFLWHQLTPKFTWPSQNKPKKNSQKIRGQLFPQLCPLLHPGGGHNCGNDCSCIACSQKVSFRCVKACDTSNHCSDWKRSCTACMQRAFLPCVCACEFWDLDHQCRNGHIAHTWKASLLNVFACVSWGNQLLCRKSCIACNWKAYLPNGFSCVSWG